VELLYFHEIISIRSHSTTSNHISASSGSVSDTTTDFLVFNSSTSPAITSTSSLLAFNSSESSNLAFNLSYACPSALTLACAASTDESPSTTIVSICV